MSAVTDPGGELQESSGARTHLGNQVADELGACLDEIPANSQDRKQSGKSPPEIVCCILSYFELRHEVSESDRQSNQILGRCGREDLSERFRNRLQNGLQCLEPVDNAVDDRLAPAEILPSLEKPIERSERVLDHRAQDVVNTREQILGLGEV